jgi:Hint module
MFSFSVAAAILCLLLPVVTYAFPTGVGSCLSGKSAVQQGAHTNLRQLDQSGGYLSVAGFQLYIDGRQVYRGTRFDFTAGVTHTIELRATGDIMRGFLIRMESMDGQDTRKSLSSTENDVTIPFACTNSEYVGGLGHNARTSKTSITGTIYMAKPSTDIQMDVTVVVTTIYSYGIAEWYNSNFDLRAVAQGTSITYTTPTSTGTTSSSGSKCTGSGSTCTSDGGCCSGFRCIRKDTQDITTNGICTASSGSSSGISSAPGITQALSYCFSGQTLVDVKNKGMTMMKDLELADEVLVAEGRYEEVYSFGHRHETLEAEFLQFHPSKLEITTNHMIKVSDRGFVPASSVMIGDELETADGNYVTVEEITTVVRQGVFAPFTTSGTILVSGIKASSYVAFQGSDYLIIGGFKTPISFQFIAYLSEAPHRIYSRVFGIGKETYTDNGMSTWISTSFLFAEWYVRQNTFVMILLLIPAVIILSVVAAFEFVLSFVF